MNNQFIKHDVRIFDAFIEKFAQKYVDQRSAFIGTGNETLAELSDDNDFDMSEVKALLRKYSVAKDDQLEEGKVNKLDIYRSDLGELLTTYYFEEKLPAGKRYIIPLKNISSRETTGQPGRGIDAIGYKQDEDGKVHLLLAEAKVSSQQQNPPDVVDKTKDSIYATHKKHHNDTAYLLDKLSSYVRKLGAKDMRVMLSLILQIEHNNTDKYSVTYGCGLVRDETCVKTPEDYGKMQTLAADFQPGDVDFVIFSFTEHTIDEAVLMFYNKVKELANGK